MSDLINQLIKINIPFHKKSDVNKFLTSVDQNKDPVLRVAAWLLSLNLIGFTEIEKKIDSLTKAYKEICNMNLSDFNNPRSSLESSEGELILLDTERTIYWFKKMASENGINDEKLLNDAIYSVQRILSVLSKIDSFYHYMQGYDRYVFITFLLGLQAMKKINAEIIFAESISFFFCKELLKIVDVNKFTRDNQFTMKHFSEIDKEIAYVRPEVYNQLVAMHVSSVHFAMKWEILSFADEHKYSNILLIWDRIILFRNIYLKYISEMCVAHIRQVSFVDNEFIIQTIQNYRNWNVKDILNYTDQKINSPKRKTKYLIILGYLLLFVIIIIVRLFFF